MTTQKMLSVMRKGIAKYKMIKDGDKIAVGVSGGKDSLALLETLAAMRRFYPKKYDIVAITVDMGFEGADFSPIAELCEKAKLCAGNIVVIGCSTSEVVGAKIGTNSNPDVAEEIFRALHDYAKSEKLFLAIQCCEHLNRAIITERKAVPFAEPVNVVPQPKAGGSVPAAAWKMMQEPTLVNFAIHHHLQNIYDDEYWDGVIEIHRLEEVR